MKLIANYTSLGDVAEGESLPLWGVLCVLTNIGTRREPKFIYIAEVADEDGPELIASGRFREAGNITAVAIDEYPSLEDDEDDSSMADKKTSAKDKMAGGK